MASEADDLAEVKEAFTLCEDAFNDNRSAALEDFRFARLGEQWPEEVRQARKGKPMHTINKMKAFIRQVVNDTRMNKPSIKVRPADSGADIATAKVYDGLIRNIEQISNADVAYDTASDHACTGGFGFFRVSIDYLHDDTFDQELLIQAISNPFSVYPDPYSTAADSADWDLCFITDLVSKEEFQRKWKGAEEVDWSSAAYGSLSEPWRNGEEIQIAEQWRREEVIRRRLLLTNGEIVDQVAFEQSRDLFDALGITVKADRQTRSYKVTHRIMTGAEILEETEWAGRYIPVIPVYGEDINVDGKRYLCSLIRDAKDAQRSFNYHRSTATELIGLAPRAPFIGPEDAFGGDYANRWKTANTENWPFLAYKGTVPPQRQPIEGGQAAASIAEALAANDDMKAVTGLYDASLGQRSNETSGRAILARQREGDTGTFHFTDNLSRAIRHAGKILIDLIPQVYTGPRMVRILGLDGQAQTVGINQPVYPMPQPGEQPHPMAGQPFQAAQGPAPGAPQPPPGPPMPGQPPMAPPGPPAGPPRAVPPDGQPPIQSPITPAVYDLTAGRYDLVVEAGPSFNTKREEAAAQMTELLRAYPPAAPVIGDLLVKNLDWPGADEIAQRLRALVPANALGKQALPPQVQAQLQQMQQVIQQGGQKLQELTQQLQTATVQLEAEKAQKGIDAQRLDLDQQKANLDEYRAETERMKTQADIAAANVTPEDVSNVDDGLERWKAEQDIQLKRDQMAHAAAMQRGQQNHEMRMAVIGRPSAPPATMNGNGASVDGATEGDGSMGDMSGEGPMDPFSELAAGMQAMGQQIAAGMQAMADAIQAQAVNQAQAMQMLASATTAPKELVRDAKGRPAGVRTVAPETMMVQ